MMYSVQVKVMPHKELLDPQGKAVSNALTSLGLPDVKEVRVGKNILLSIEATNETEAKKIGEEAAKKLLANQVMEMFEIEVVK